MKWMSRQAPRLVGVIFIWAAVYKLLKPASATMALESLMIPVAVSKVLVALAIIAEMHLGILLVAMKELRFALRASTILMMVFTVYLFYLSTLAHPPSCGCLGLTGVFNHSKLEAVFGVARNLAILWVLRLGADYYFPTPDEPPAQAAVASA